LIQHFFSKQFFLFILCGGTAAAVNFLSRIVFNNWFSFSLSVIFAYLLGMITAFTLAKIFVFQNSSQGTAQSLFFFVIVNLFSILQTWTISIIMVTYLLPWLHIKQFAHEIAHGVGVLVPVFTSFLGHRKWSFRGA